MNAALSLPAPVWTVELRVKVVPEGFHNEIVGPMADGTLKVKIATTVHKGKANDELRSFLARYYGVPRSSVTVSNDVATELKLVRIAA